MFFKHHLNIKKYSVIICVLLIGILLHFLGKTEGIIRADDGRNLLISGPTSLIVQKVIAGPALGLGADANILSIFSVFSIIDARTLSFSEQQKAWLYLYRYLQHAQSFDPWFWDINRLSSGLLINQEKFQRKAIAILEKGAISRPWDWETPFIAGYLAHDLLKDDALALSLMKEAAQRPGAPSMIVGLAAKFMQKELTIADTITFLTMMKKSLPKEYGSEIESKIKKLRQEQEGSYGVKRLYNN